MRAQPDTVVDASFLVPIIADDSGRASEPS